MASSPLLFFSFSLFFLSVFSESSDVLLLLEKIKPALQGPSSPENLQLSSWNVSTPPCLWRGLQWTSSTAGGAPLPCHEAAVLSNRSLAADPSLQLLSIRLPAADLTGSIPQEIGDLSSLQSLYLGVNSLSGALPLELGSCPSLSLLLKSPWLPSLKTLTLSLKVPTPSCCCLPGHTLTYPLLHYQHRLGALM